MDKIILKGMTFFAHHGVTEVERVQGQNFVVDVEIAADTEAAAKADDLGLTVDYDAVFRSVEEIVTGENVVLIETLADRIAAAVLSAPRAEAVKVRVRKPSPPIEGELEWAGVEITRAKK